MKLLFMAYWTRTCRKVGNPRKSSCCAAKSRFSEHSLRTRKNLANLTKKPPFRTTYKTWLGITCNFRANDYESFAVLAKKSGAFKDRLTIGGNNNIIPVSADGQVRPSKDFINQHENKIQP